MGRPRGSKNGRPMGRQASKELTPAQQRDQAELEWEQLLQGTQTERLRVLRRTMFDEGADHRVFARSVSRGLQENEAAWGRVWLETMGFVKAEDLQQYTILVIERVLEVIRPFVPEQELPKLMAKLSDDIGGRG